ncbi:pyruvate ferredoxin oxidoreductase, gamma subunit [Thermofilum pendens Hrk 5]|uniref:pyruvate synthase n=1 Tax=Thermofilum pendens (strain DSM 2475 / Hrk 5) TaxID=368408 RepID=A1RXP6_THEPD|nr:pyruvate ferredoxin oxidoreductase, gamma subunit [Thermofilum pendens Hrk 5]
MRWHGRGGQGVVTSSELLALAALREGKFVYHAPEFGPERRGAPVKAYTRISREPIELHSGIYEPSAVVVIDPSLQNDPSIASGLRKGGLIVVNAKSPGDVLLRSAQEKGAEVWYVDAYSIAMEVFGRPFYNTPMLGAFVRASNVVSLESVVSVAMERFSKDSKLAQLNVLAIRRAYDEVKKYE